MNADVTQDVSVVLDKLTIGSADSLTIQHGNTLLLDMQPLRPSSGQIQNDGSMSLSASGAIENSTTLRFNGEVLLTGAGTLSSTDDVGNTLTGLRRTAKLTNDTNHTIEFAGQLGFDRLIIDNKGTIRPVGSTLLTINPSGRRQPQCCIVDQLRKHFARW